MNIPGLIQSQLSQQTIERISNSIGERPEGTASALGAAFLAILGSLCGKATGSQNGATDVFNLLKQGQNQGAWTDNINSAVEGLGGGSPPAASQSLLGTLLGSKLGPVSDFISANSGIRGSSAMSLLSIAAPVLMGTLSKHVSTQGLNADGLGQLLSSQGSYLKDAMPPGLSNTLGIGHLLSGTQKFDPASIKAAVPERPQAQFAGGGGILKWAWVPILLGVVGWFALNQMHRAPATGGTSENSGNASTSGRGYSGADFSKLQLTPGGVADHLTKAISAGAWGNSVPLTGFTTDNKGMLADSAKNDVREIATVMAAVPNLKLRITGRGDTDKAGLDRASAIKSALLSAGVAEDRIQVSGEPGAGMPTATLLK
jgi:outer membrane protein OmpA-like peptidoglycan-associated protein